ncbi:MAG: HDIG domain-containing protein [Candidatus Aenigmatarchaeota archaeon]
MKREEALELLNQNIKKEYLIKHSIAVEAIMRGVASFLGENIEEWGIVGLLHDIDFEKTENSPEKHGILAEEILRERVREDLIKVIKAHNFENNGTKPEKNIEKALIAADSVSGLIIATALVMPSKKLEEVRVESIIKSFKDKTFARRCSRERITFCEDIGIQKEKFFEISLKSLQKIHEELGL